MRHKVGAIILAAGSGSRFGGYKQFARVAGKTILEHAIRLCVPFVNEIVLTLPAAFISKGLSRSVVGGKNRLESIMCGYNLMRSLGGCDKMLIVDASRCNTASRVIRELLDALDLVDCAFPVIKATNTVCTLDKQIVIQSKVGMYEHQTPTALRWDTLTQCMLHAADDDGFSMAYVVTKYKLGTTMVTRGDDYNMKVTNPSDLQLFSVLQASKKGKEELIHAPQWGGCYEPH